MKKSLLFFLMLNLFALPLRAEEFSDTETYRAVYEKLQTGYIKPQSASDSALMVLKALPAVDRKLRVADDEKRVSLYYDARVVRSFLKPENPEDVNASLKLTIRVLKAAQNVSNKVKEKDFELADILLENGINGGLDGNSKYYPAFGAEEKDRLKNRRHFATRMIDEVLYVKIGAFNKFTLKNLREAVEDHPQARAAVLDLRGSPGGLFSQAVDIADAFLDEGIIASEHGRNENRLKYYTAQAGDILTGRPLVVLIDGGTMSSAEVVAAALKEQSRAKLIGTGSFGKGTRQDLTELPNGAELGCTAAYIYTPSGQKLDKLGVSPDVCTFNMGDGRRLEDVLNRPQPQQCGREDRERRNLDLEAAVKLLKERI